MAEIQISDTSTVYPSIPPNTTRTLPLSHLDTDPNLDVTFRTLRVYATSPTGPTADPFDVITAALSKALNLYFPLAGTIHRAAPNARPHLLCSPRQGVPVTRATCAATLTSSGGSAICTGDPILDHLVPDPGLEDAIRNPCTMQVTQFACGGFTLGTCLHHHLCDGAGATMFLTTIGELARGAVQPVVEPVWDRDALLGPRKPPKVEVEFEKVLSVGSGGLVNPDHRLDRSRGDVVRESFHVSESGLERFKNRLFEESGSRFTTFEALGAFIWRARVKATKVPDTTTVKFSYSMSIRKATNPPLPANYWGNTIIPVYVPLTAHQLLQNTLHETATHIKRSKCNVTDEYVRSYVDFQELHYSYGITAGDEVSGFTDWRHLPHSGVDFGWGPPAVVLPLSFRLLGSVEPCFFLPYGEVGGEMERGGFRVLVSLPPHAMPEFAAEMEMFKA